MFLKILKIISGPVIGCVIGYFTNLLAVKMLFYPKKEVKVFGHRLPFTPGVIPKGKPRLAHAIGRAVGETLITKDDVEAKIISPEVSGHLTDSIMEKLSSPIKSGIISVTNLPESMYADGKNKIAETVSREVVKAVSDVDFGQLIKDKGAPVIRESISNPMISMFLTDELIASVSDRLGVKISNMVRDNGIDYVKPFVEKKIDELDSSTSVELLNKVNISDMMLRGIISSLITSVMKSSINSVFEQVNISQIVEDKINAMDIDELEKMIIQVMKKELNAIINLGAVIGFVLGLLNLLIDYVL